MTHQTRNAGIDILKAICIVLVVIWHSQPVTAAMLSDQNMAAFAGRQMIRFFYWDLSLLAVPSFIFISLYLFIGKLSEAEDYWKKRFLRLIQIYFFWVGIQFIIYLLLGGGLPLPLKTIIRSGGPDLNFGALMPPLPSIFYFLFILILCTVLAFLFHKLPEKIRWPVAVVVVTASCLYFIYTSVKGIGIDTRSMKGYYLYVPLACYLHYYRDKFIQYRFLFFGGYLLSLLFEWHFNGMASAYGRMSVLFGTLTLVSVFVSGWSAANRPVRLLSKYSMGIFALHPYFLAAVRASYALLNKNDQFSPPTSATQGLLIFIATFGLTCIGVWFLSGTSLRRYIS